MSYCDWDQASATAVRYHDTEWGVPLFDDRRQFEFLMLEVMQCGLSWNLMLKKREIFRACFDGFDYDLVAQYGEAETVRILETEGMIRSRRKVEAVIANARRFQAVRQEFGSFSDYLWGFTKRRTILYRRHAEGWIPVSNGLSARISADLRRRGFRYLGPVTVYSHLQACGIINDHSHECPRYAQINAAARTARREPDGEVGVQFFGSTAK